MSFTKPHVLISVVNITHQLLLKYQILSATNEISLLEYLFKNNTI